MRPTAALLAAALATAATAARAQDVPQVISPLRVESDHNGVNMATGKTTPAGPALSVPAAPSLVFDRVQNAAPYVRGRVSGGAGRFRSAIIRCTPAAPLRNPSCAATRWIARA